MRKTKKDLLKQIEKLKQDIKEIQADKDRMHYDRNLYRDYLRSKFLWLIQCLEEKKTPNLAWFIKDITTIFSKGERFYW